MFGHRDKFALHDPPGGFLFIGECALDCGAVFRIQFGQNRLLLALFEIFDNRDRVIGVELFGEIGNLAGVEHFDQVFANMLVHLREHVGAYQITKGFGERGTLIRINQFE